MMGGDPGLSKHLAGIRQKFWTRIVHETGEQVQIVCADSLAQLASKYPQLEVFEPSPEWQTEHLPFPKNVSAPRYSDSVNSPSSNRNSWKEVFRIANFDRIKAAIASARWMNVNSETSTSK